MEKLREVWEQLQEHLKVRFRAENYGVPYFGRKRSDARKEAAGARARNVVEDLNGRAPTRSVGRRPFKPQTALLARRTFVGSK
jgi:hypothetical protein